MVGGRIGAHQEERVAAPQVIETHARGAGTDRLAQTHPRGLVTVIGAVVDVVGAVDAGEELQQEAGLVRGAAADVEEGMARIGGGQLGAGAFQRLSPADLGIVRLSLAQQERRGQTSGLLQLARRHPGQLGDAESLEEAGRNRALHVGRHRLHRLLAHFETPADLVAHAATRPAHAERAGLARVRGPQCAPHFPGAAATHGLGECVANGGPTASGLSAHAGAPSAAASGEVRPAGRASGNILVRMDPASRSAARS